jgi:Cu/Zn superoxide dismutase
MNKKIILMMVATLACTGIAATNERMAVAVFRDANKNVLGSAIFFEDSTGLEVNVTLRKLSPGRMTLSVHENTTCGTRSKTAFGDAGNALKLDAGMLLETMVGEKGTAFERQDSARTLASSDRADSLMRKALILHIGDSKGPRVACGVIHNYP